jgi:tRNA1(Val) A37 N6-methylase TrmN6
LRYHHIGPVLGRVKFAVTEEISTGGLLGGRVIYKQLRDGHRSGFEPVLLAASVPAKPGEIVLEAGTGAGAALLCLGARVKGVRGIGVERDATLANLSNINFKLNDLRELFTIQGDASALPFRPDSFHHVLANPPWFGARSTASPDAKRALAHHASPELLPRWIAELARVLRAKGGICLVLPASSFAMAAAALRTSGCGGVTLIPLWPRAGLAAKMIILTACKGSKSPDAVHPGLVLHDEGGITEAADEILRGGHMISSELNTA